MALLWIEGFEGFGTGVTPSPTGIIGRKYPVILNESSMDIVTGRGGVGYALQLTILNEYIGSPNLTTDATCILGVAVQIPNTTLLNRLFSLYDGATQGINVRVNTDGTLAVYNGPTLLGTTINALTVSTWYYIELKVLTNNSTGTVDIHVDGSDWLALTNQDTQPGANAYHTAFRLGPPANGISNLFDDIFFLDGSGSKNNDFLGNRKVVDLDPDGAGDSTNWTPSAGSNYQNVDDGNLTDEDTTYNETGSDAIDDLYTYGNLPAIAASVDGIQITSEARVTSGSMDLSNMIKTGTTTSPGTPETITSTSYVTTTRIEEDDPDTAIAWTPSGVDGAQFGIRANT